MVVNEDEFGYIWSNVSREQRYSDIHVVSVNHELDEAPYGPRQLGTEVVQYIIIPTGEKGFIVLEWEAILDNTAAGEYLPEQEQQGSQLQQQQQPEKQEDKKKEERDTPNNNDDNNKNNNKSSNNNKKQNSNLSLAKLNSSRYFRGRYWSDLTQAFIPRHSTRSTAHTQRGTHATNKPTLLRRYFPAQFPNPGHIPGGNREHHIHIRIRNPIHFHIHVPIHILFYVLHLQYGHNYTERHGDNEDYEDYEDYKDYDEDISFRLVEYNNHCVLG
ncbi:hypothetical protein F5Y09DRAFT_354317 [Xylaria sp. FL1042]|nr:hypothetical protein F5Y09DRAFT_354317 [Xylaria sp. FL1042]